jgi:hypothetical protein
MDIANARTVLGDFDDARSEHRGVATTFRRDGERFLVRTEGPQGQLEEYEITHTFGVEPLQQYLVPFPGGRMQALGIAWDTRPIEDGGQRWFHLYPHEEIGPDDPLHWTGVQLRWNYMCAECHSTHLQRGYDVAHDTYQTTWSEIDVSCEACHGPGSAPVAWVEAAARGDPRLDVRLGDRDRGRWILDPNTGIAQRSVKRARPTQVEACARCHSRRTTITSDYPYGRPLLDTHIPALLEEGLYHADGQILDEVYVWGSFVQSRMYAAGVTCSDCHDPHSLDTRNRGGNATCASCHSPARFDTPEHHHHERASTGASCVACHMPARTYMGVDARRDHSMRIPRPDPSVALGTPNVCNGCHPDRRGIPLGHDLRGARRRPTSHRRPDHPRRRSRGQHKREHQKRRDPSENHALRDRLSRPPILSAARIPRCEALHSPCAFSAPHGLFEPPPGSRLPATMTSPLVTERVGCVVERSAGD